MIARTLFFGLAGTRLVRAALYEKVGEPYRDLVDKYLGPPDAGTEIDLRREKIREYLAEGANCPHCLGFWLTVGCIVTWQRFPIARPLVQGLASAAILSVIVEHYPDFTFEPDDD